MKSTPRKLNIAAIIIDFLGPIDLVEITVAIAFGASVQPFTNITPITNKDVIKRGTFFVQRLINSNKLGTVASAKNITFLS
jgi:hypothetical protein